MKEKLLNLVAKVQVKHSITNSNLDPVLEDLARLVAKECVDLCEERVKAFDVAGNEYIVIKHHSQELCVKAIKEGFGV